MDIVSLGEVLIDLFPAQVGRSLSQVSAFHPKPGGAPANVAVAAARLGLTSAFIGKVGDDEWGHFLSQVLTVEGVDVRGLRFDPIARTTIVFLSQPDVNSYDCLFYRNPGADTCLRTDELDEDLLRETRAFQFGSLSLTDEPSRTATRAAIGIAQAAGALVCYDVNYRPSLWKDARAAREMALDLISSVNLVKVNERELELLTNNDDAAVGARQLRAFGPDICVVTLGAQGSYLQTAEGEAFAPAFSVDTVDAAGCGDAFLAALIGQLIRSDNWRTRLTTDQLQAYLQYANAAGALTATAQGVISALPTAGQVTEFLRNTHDRTNPNEFE